MRFILKCFLIAFILFVTKVSSAEDVSFANGSYQEILDLAKQQNKIIMIDFVTDWCKWCIETDRKVYTNPEVAGFANENQINWKIDAEKGEGPDVAKKYGVKGFPTIVFTNAEGVEIDRIYGYIPADQFLKKMKDYNAGTNTYGSIMKLLEANPDDATANYLMAEKISSNGLDGDPKIYLNKTITIDPSNASGYTDDSEFMLAYINEDPEALKSAINKYPSSEKVKDGFLNLASYYAEKGDNKLAEDYYKQGFDKFGKDDFDMVQSYGGYLLNEGSKIMRKENSTEDERKEGIKILEKCLEYVKGTVNEASAYYIMSDLYLQNKDIKKANECIDKSLVIFDRKLYREQKEKINKQEAVK